MEAILYGKSTAHTGRTRCAASVEVIFLDVVHQDSERTVVTLGSEAEKHYYS